MNLGIDPPKGVLLFGPPGTGKTLCARAVANRTDACFIRVIGSELVQKYVGEVCFTSSRLHSCHFISIEAGLQMQKGCPKMTWWDCVKNDRESLGQCQKDVQFRNKWIRRINGASG